MTNLLVRVDSVENETFGYYQVKYMEVRWIDDFCWYGWVLHNTDGTTATFKSGNVKVCIWNSVEEEYQLAK